MALGITTSLIGVYSPRTVQIVITGLTVGQAYEVTGNWSGGSWPVRAGTGVAASSQLVLSDVTSPIGTNLTYTVTHAAATATSTALIVGYPRRYVLQSLSGDASVHFDMVRNGAPQAMALRQSAFAIPGRRHPVVRYDVSAAQSGQLLVDTEGEETRKLRAVLESGVPVLLRTDGGILDLDATSFLSWTGVSSSLIGMTRRRWELSYTVIDDPEPDTLTGLPTWDDFDASYAGLTWDQFDTEWAGSTWDAFDVHDWATRAAT